VTAPVCIILAGGLGTRLRAMVGSVPKCLAPVRGRPFLHWQIASLRARGVQRFLLSLGHGAEQVVAAAAALPEPHHIACVTEPQPLGTGGAIAFAMDAHGLTDVLVANGDSFVGGSLQPLLAPLRAAEQLRLAAVPVPERARFGGLQPDSQGRVLQFLEKGTQGPGLINAGLYRLQRSALPVGGGLSYSLEAECFPALVGRAALYATELAGPFIDIGVPEDYQRYEREHEHFC
jgi:D-glycero-alpha-D-manno-heptose 1-phosphate guanylyltransferase